MKTLCTNTVGNNLYFTMSICLESAKNNACFRLQHRN
jgi:hypothetical protein